MSDKAKIDDGGPAFPALDVHCASEIIMEGNKPHGMSLRDWFAGQAITGLCIDLRGSGYRDRELATRALGIADAMLAERAKEGGK